MSTVNDLREIPLLSSLDLPTLADTARRVRHCSFRPGQHILIEGEQAPGLYFVLGGKVRLSRTAADGREQVLAMIGPGEPFDMVPLFDGGPNPSSARAMSPVSCLLLSREDLLALISRHPGLALAMLGAMSGQLRELVGLVEDLAFRTVRARLARQLLAEAAEGSADLTQQELAGRAGTVREIAGRALRRLAEEGLVRLERGRVIVLDPAGLARVIEE
ncbi:Crp/Fnr family transcriptional regulator [Oscillochloris sp. ZM17-4]|uniref:Crp/Fnr family transcriptional regulator n=1 Tax=Oscillochloris sp. ZM17-4 TaxID=2866714 RepID=UPI001C73C390|nr:Crp/Fnr family transcriptional regulator [Oscillochloris sp. ZM17-4]MBX0331192.1 Crp/Fnr family transcriptional regulator [Oscillochloris sp. ZM17-4]